METNNTPNLLALFSHLVNILKFWGYAHQTLPKLLGLDKATHQMVVKNYKILLTIAPKDVDPKECDLDEMNYRRDREELLFRANHFKVRFRADTMAGQALLLKLLQECKTFQVGDLDLGDINNEEELESANKVMDELASKKFLAQELDDTYQHIRLWVDYDFKKSVPPSVRFKCLHEVDVDDPPNFLKAVDKVFLVETNSTMLDGLAENCSHLQTHTLYINWYGSFGPEEALQELKDSPLFHSVKRLKLGIDEKEDYENLLLALQRLFGILPNLNSFEFCDYDEKVGMNFISFLQHLLSFNQLQQVEVQRKGSYQITLHCSAAEIQLSSQTKKSFRAKDLEVECKSSDFVRDGEMLELTNFECFKCKSIEAVTNGVLPDANSSLPKLRFPVKRIVVDCGKNEPFSLAGFRGKIALKFKDEDFTKWAPMVEELEAQPLTICSYYQDTLSKSTLEEILHIVTAKNLVELDVWINPEEDEDWETVAGLLNNCSTLNKVKFRVEADYIQERVASLIPKFTCCVEWVLRLSHQTPIPALQELANSCESKIKFTKW